MMIYKILILVAMIFAGLAAFRVPSPPKLDVHWGWLAIMIWLLAGLI